MDIEISDFAKICRMCLNTDNLLKCLFPESTDEVNEMEEILQMVDALIIYSVSKSDNLPNNICLKCIDQIRATYNFKIQCERSFELLASILETYNLGLKNETERVSLDEQGESGESENSEILSIKVEDPLEFIVPIETSLNDGEFNCTYCAKSFSQEVHLRKHISILHNNVGNLCYDHCGSPTKLQTDTPLCYSENTMEYLMKCEIETDEFNAEESLVGTISGGDNCSINFVETLGLTEPKYDKKLPTPDDDNDDSNFLSIHEQSDENDNESGHNQPQNAKLFKSKSEPMAGNNSLKNTNIDDKQSKGDKDSPLKINHKCDICNKIFTRSSDLKRHKNTHSKNKPFVCKICNKSFSRSDHLRRHQLKEEKFKPYVCPKYGQGFLRVDSLRRHQVDNQSKGHKDLPLKRGHKCDICNKTFKRLSDLKRHKNTHSKNKPFVCKICNKSFSRSDHLRIHQLKHRNFKAYVCPECGEGFLRADSLKRHQLDNHENESPSKKAHKCNICNKTFSYLSYLTRHKVTHLEQKPFMCEVCNKGFSRAGRLKTHKFKHHNDEPYVCTDCVRGFSSSADLRKHQLHYHKIHSHSKTHHKCDICNKFFINSSNLDRHMKIDHTSYQTPTEHKRNCPDTFDLNDALTTHTKDHTFDTQSHTQKEQLEVMGNQPNNTEVEMVNDFLKIEIEKKDYKNISNG